MYRKTILIWLLVGGGLGLFCCQTPGSDPNVEHILGIPTSEIKQELDNLVALWYPRIVDTVHGGYLTNFEYDWSLAQDQPKMLVTQARGLWTAARLLQYYPDQTDLMDAAEHGFQFLTAALWEKEGGGFHLHWPKREEDQHFRLTYASAFALYALAEFAKVKDDPAVLDWVERCFDWLEDNAHDRELGGYYNLVLLNGAKAEDRGWGNGKWKGQNTSIHLLEALANTYQVLPLPKIKDRLEEMLLIVRDRFVRENGSLQLYYTNDWSAVNYRDSSRQFIIDHIYDDHVSFGHDIETAFLLYEAASILQDGKADPKTLEVAKRMLDHSLSTGFEKQFQGIFDKGYYFRDQGEIEVIDRHKSWWAQAEAWHALALFSHLFPEEEIYPEAFREMWSYIRSHLIDPKHGGWYNAGLDESPEAAQQRKAHQWKGAYHNGRALVQVLEYAEQSVLEH